MKKLTVILLAVLGLLALDWMLVGLVPGGSAKATELCADCGMTRRVHSAWTIRPSWQWRFQEGDAAATPVSRFLRAQGGPACALHLWRDYSGLRLYAGRPMASFIGAKDPRADRVLAEERALAALDPALAREAVRARLKRPSLDSGILPPWFASRGWPPASAAEARSWWAAVKEAR